MVEQHGQVRQAKSGITLRCAQSQWAILTFYKASTIAEMSMPRNKSKQKQHHRYPRRHSSSSPNIVVSPKPRFLLHHAPLYTALAFALGLFFKLYAIDGDGMIIPILRRTAPLEVLYVCGHRVQFTLFSVDVPRPLDIIEVGRANARSLLFFNLSIASSIFFRELTCSSPLISWASFFNSTIFLRIRPSAARSSRNVLSCLCNVSTHWANCPSFGYRSFCS
jgi:hypothetical protein